MRCISKSEFLLRFDGTVTSTARVIFMLYEYSFRNIIIERCKVNVRYHGARSSMVSRVNVRICNSVRDTMASNFNTFLHFIRRNHTYNSDSEHVHVLEKLGEKN